RGHSDRGESIALRAMRGDRPFGVQRERAGGAFWPDRVSADRRAALFHHPGAAWFLLVQVGDKAGGDSETRGGAGAGHRNRRRMGSRHNRQRQGGVGKNTAALLTEPPLVWWQGAKNSRRQDHRSDRR